jgi:Protein of unknown function (DUF1579)
MRTLKNAVATIAGALAVALLIAPSFAEEPKTNESAAASPAAGSMNDQEMMAKMTEMAKLNENHKLLASLDGTWKYTVKFWMNGDPTTKPDESKGTATRKSVMGGRFVMMDVKGKMEMPGPDGKMKQFEFMGHGTEGYDNVKQKFVSTWFDNMGTGIMMADGTYDEGSKSLTYTGEYEGLPGMKQKIREVVKLTDKNHMVLEWYETRGDKEVKTMEIDYTRQT